VFCIIEFIIRQHHKLPQKGIKRIMVNTVILLGRLGQDPELRYFESGSCKARFSLAVDRPVSKGAERITDWFTIEAWGKLAEFCGEWVKKGTMVSVEGALDISQWTDNTGNVREMTIINAAKVNFAGSKKDNQTTMAGSAPF
jgi:single-strand DNA-binding protein